MSFGIVAAVEQTVAHLLIVEQAEIVKRIQRDLSLLPSCPNAQIVLVCIRVLRAEGLLWAYF